MKPSSQTRQSNSTLDEDQLSWVDCFCVVNFDLEIGSKLELTFPSTYALSEKEISSICYLAFPDSNSGLLGDLIYSFRVRRSLDEATVTNAHKNRLLQQQICRDYCSALQPSPSHFYGFTYFRQMKDATNRRGYFQKSLVLLSRYPFVNLFLACVSQVAPHYFEHGLPALETIWKEMSSWPPPLPATPMILSLFSTPFQVIIPSKHSALAAFSTSSSMGLLSSPSGNKVPTHFCRHSLIHMITATLDTMSNPGGGGGSPSSSSSVSPRVTSNDLLRFTIPVHSHLDYTLLFRALLGNIQLAWELVLTNEPILVYAPNPQVASDTVNTLVSLIWPLQYATDYRPFFTVHDAEFKQYSCCSENQAPPVILGVANPHFLKLAENRFHVIGVSDAGSMPIYCSATASNSPVAPGSPVGGSNSSIRRSTSNATISSLHLSDSSGSLALSAKRKLNALKKVEERVGIYTSYKAHLKRANNLGREFVEELQKGSSNSRDVLCSLLARFFSDLTSSLLGPLESFINNNLMPRHNAFNPLMGVPTLTRFDPEEFLTKLASSGPHLTSTVKGDWPGLYRRFFKSPNFHLWFSRRSDELKQHIGLEHLKLFAEADVQSWCAGRLEVEMIDLLMRTKDLQSRLILSGAKMPPGLDQKLTSQYLQIARSLPPDTMDIVINSFLVGSKQ